MGIFSVAHGAYAAPINGQGDSLKLDFRENPDNAAEQHLTITSPAGDVAHLAFQKNGGLVSTSLVPVPVDPSSKPVLGVQPAELPPPPPPPPNERPKFEFDKDGKLLAEPGTAAPLTSGGFPEPRRGQDHSDTVGVPAVGVDQEQLASER